MTITLFTVFSNTALADWTTGLGYIQPQDYRKDNEINPLPFGLSFVPVLSYRGERLTFYGPFLRYALIKGAIALNLNFNVIGDNYEAYEVERRKTGWNAGASLRLYFLTLSYGSDISKTYNGNVFIASVGHRFSLLNDRLFVIPTISKQYVSKSFTNYYYGVSADEVGEFEEYSLENAVNDIYGLRMSYALNATESISLNFNYKVFDNEIYNSPTIALRQYNTLSIFYNYKL